jgi:HSP20 family protein
MHIMIRRKDKKAEIVPKELWTPAANPMSLLHDMDRLFDDFRAEWESTFLTQARPSSEVIRQPLVDVADNGKEYVVSAELPGISKEDLNVEVTESRIEISSEKRSEETDSKEGYIRRERSYSSFHRSIPLPGEILPGKAEAELREGVLTVKLPKVKPEEKKGKKLPVK